LLAVSHDQALVNAADHVIRLRTFDPSDPKGCQKTSAAV